MTAHSSILAWKIPCIEEPGRQFRGCKELDMTEHTNTHIVNIQPFVIFPVSTLLASILSLRFAPKVSSIINYLLFPPCMISLRFSTSYSLWQDHLTLSFDKFLHAQQFLSEASPLQVASHDPLHHQSMLLLNSIFQSDLENSHVIVSLCSHLWYANHTAL